MVSSTIMQMRKAKTHWEEPEHRVTPKTSALKELRKATNGKKAKDT
jgi:hypothetical protein